MAVVRPGRVQAVLGLRDELASGVRSAIHARASGPPAPCVSLVLHICSPKQAKEEQEREEQEEQEEEEEEQQQE